MTDELKPTEYTAPSAGTDTGATDGGQQPDGGQTQISSTVPQQYTAKDYDELYSQMRDYMDSHRPMSKEEIEKLRKKQKAEKIISSIADATMAVANLWGTSQYAPNMYNGENSMTSKAQARFDKEKAEREANDREWFNMAMNYKKMQDADRDRGLQVWQAEQSLARQDRAYNDSRADHDAEFKRRGEWHEEEKERWQKQFDEGVRQFNVHNDNEKKRLGMEAQRLAQQSLKGQMTFNLGSGNGNVSLSTDRLNAQTVSRIFSTLPEEIRNGVKGEPIYETEKDGNGKPVTDFSGKPKKIIIGYAAPSTEAMLVAIGANVENSPATQSAIRQVAGLETGNRNTTMPGVGANNRMPGVK